MEGIFTLAMWVSLMALAIPTVTFVLEVLLGLRGRPAARASENLRVLPKSRVAVVVPAHNESAGIPATIVAIREQLRPGDRLLIVADNCHDDTAAVARALGAEVTERFDDLRRGKGYALDHGVFVLRQDPPDMILMVDADCILQPGGLAALAGRCGELVRPIQAQYLMRAPAGASVKTKVAELAWLVKNRVRPLGASRLGWPCQLTGSGMMFPWSLIDKAPLASGHLVEDMQLGAWLAQQGAAPVYCDEALVTSVFPSEDGSLAAQRQRWEHGHLALILSQGPRMISQALLGRRWALLGMALDMCVPPLTSLILLLTLLLPLALLHAFVLGGGLLVSCAALMLSAVGVAVGSAWWAHGRQVVSSSELAAVPAYALSKISVYAGFMVRRQMSWVRTGRDHESK